MVIVVVAAIIGVVVYLKTKDSDTSSDDPASGRPHRKEAVATDTPRCSKIGKVILNANGSAVDAAIAAMFCLGVVSLHSSGIGGGGITLVYNVSLQEAADFREFAPAPAYRDMFKGHENHGKAKKGDLLYFCSDLTSHITKK